MEHSVWGVITIHIKTNGKNKRRKRWTFWNTNEAAGGAMLSLQHPLVWTHLETVLLLMWDDVAFAQALRWSLISPNQPETSGWVLVSHRVPLGRGTKWEAELRTVANFWDTDTLRGAGVNLDLLQNTSPGLMILLPLAVPKAEMFPSREAVRAAQAAFPVGHKHSCLRGHQTSPPPIRLCKSWAGEMDQPKSGDLSWWGSSNGCSSSLVGTSRN